MEKFDKDNDKAFSYVLVSLVLTAVIIAGVKIIHDKKSYRFDHDKEEIINRAKLVKVIDYNKNWD